MMSIPKMYTTQSAKTTPSTDEVKEILESFPFISKIIQNKPNTFKTTCGKVEFILSSGEYIAKNGMKLYDFTVEVRYKDRILVAIVDTVMYGVKRKDPNKIIWKAGQAASNKLMRSQISEYMDHIDITLKELDDLVEENETRRKQLRDIFDMVEETQIDLNQFASNLILEGY